MIEGTASRSMQVLANMLEGRTGQVLSEGRLWRLETSLRPVMRANGLRSLDQLVSNIELEPDSSLALEAVNALLNNETSFYRDAHIFQLLAMDIIPLLMAQVQAEDRPRQLRIWCAGCSTGQEAFSLAMLFQNHREQMGWRDWRLQILATDVSGTAIDRARSGVIPQMDVQRGLPITDLLKWLEPAGDKWKISPVVQDMIDFRVDNLCDPTAPVGEYDLVLCRNVLLYFSADRKKRIFTALSKHCAIGGYLLLGAGETTIGHTVDFVASQRYRGTYRRQDNLLAGAGI